MFCFIRFHRLLTSWLETRHPDVQRIAGTASGPLRHDVRAAAVVDVAARARRAAWDPKGSAVSGRVWSDPVDALSLVLPLRANNRH